MRVKNAHKANLHSNLVTNLQASVLRLDTLSSSRTVRDQQKPAMIAEDQNCETGEKFASNIAGARRAFQNTMTTWMEVTNVDRRHVKTKQIATSTLRDEDTARNHDPSPMHIGTESVNVMTSVSCENVSFIFSIEREVNVMAISHRRHSRMATRAKSTH